MLPRLGWWRPGLVQAIDPEAPARMPVATCRLGDEAEPRRSRLDLRRSCYDAATIPIPVASADASISRMSSGSHQETNDAGSPASVEIALVSHDAVDALFGCAACAARDTSPAVRSTD
jgi:hypothetical protein